MPRALALAALILPVVADGQARIALLHTAPRTARAGQSLEISGTMFGAAEVDRAVLHHRLSGEQKYAQVEMAPVTRRGRSYVSMEAEPTRYPPISSKTWFHSRSS